MPYVRSKLVKCPSLYPSLENRTVINWNMSPSGAKLPTCWKMHRRTLHANLLHRRGFRTSHRVCVASQSMAGPICTYIGWVYWGDKASLPYLGDNVSVRGLVSDHGLVWVHGLVCDYCVVSWLWSMTMVWSVTMVWTVTWSGQWPWSGNACVDGSCMCVYI